MANLPAPEPDFGKLTFENYIKMTKFNVNDVELLGAVETVYDFVGDLGYNDTTLSAEEEQLQMLMESDLSDTVSDFSQISLSSRPQRKKKRSDRWRSRTSSIAIAEYQKEEQNKKVEKFNTPQLDLQVHEEVCRFTPKSGRSSSSDKRVATPIIEKEPHDKTSVWSEKLENSKPSETSTPTNNELLSEQSRLHKSKHKRQHSGKHSPQNIESNSETSVNGQEQRRKKKRKSGRKPKCYEHLEVSADSARGIQVLDAMLGRNMRAAERKSKRNLHL